MWEILLLILLILIYILYYYIKKYNKIKYAMSFRESLDLVNLPIITFYINNQKFNFLLDTGCTDSLIDEASLKILNDVQLLDTNNKIHFAGLEETHSTTHICNLSLYYKDNEYKEQFIVNDLEILFSNIKNESGITLHGILGTKFFEKYKYVLDFKELLAYNK